MQNKVVMGIIKRLRDYQDTLEIYQEPGMAGQVWRILFNEDGDSRNPMSELCNAKETADLKTLYGPKIREASAGALAVLKKYLPRAIGRLKHRLLYDPAREPLDIPRRKEGDEDFDASSFFGCRPDQNAMALILQQHRFRMAWLKDKVGGLASLPIGEF